MVFVSCPIAISESLAKSIVGDGLAACVNIVPGVKSVYFWKGELQVESEDMLIIKSHKSLWDKLESGVKALHPYEVPEIICVSIQDGYQPYLDWLHSATRPN